MRAGSRCLLSGVHRGGKSIGVTESRYTFAGHGWKTHPEGPRRAVPCAGVAEQRGQPYPAAHCFIPERVAFRAILVPTSLRQHTTHFTEIRKNWIQLVQGPSIKRTGSPVAVLGCEFRCGKPLTVYFRIIRIALP